MVWFIIIGVVFCIGAIAAFLALFLGTSETDGAWKAVWALTAFIICSLCVFGAFRSFIAAGRTINRDSCESYAEQTGYETKLIITTQFDGGTCMVSFDDKWVPRDQLWAEMRQP